MMLQGKARTLAFYQAATGKDAQDHIAADHGLADFQVYEFPADDDDPYQEQALTTPQSSTSTSNAKHTRSESAKPPAK
jgi:hypothetical protein